MRPVRFRINSRMMTGGFCDHDQTRMTCSRAANITTCRRAGHAPDLADPGAGVASMSPLVCLPEELPWYSAVSLGP